MSTSFATKQDVQHLGELITLRIDALESHTTERFESLEARMNLRFAGVDSAMQSLESRLLIKLGLLMTALFGIAGTALTLLQ